MHFTSKSISFPELTLDPRIPSKSTMMFKISLFSSATKAETGQDVKRGVNEQNQGIRYIWWYTWVVFHSSCSSFLLCMDLVSINMKYICSCKGVLPSILYVPSQSTSPWTVNWKWTRLISFVDEFRWTQTGIHAFIYVRQTDDELVDRWYITCVMVRGLNTFVESVRLYSFSLLSLLPVMTVCLDSRKRFLSVLVSPSSRYVGQCRILIDDLLSGLV